MRQIASIQGLWALATLIEVVDRPETAVAALTHGERSTRPPPLPPRDAGAKQTATS